MFERYVEQARRAVYFSVLPAVQEKVLIGSEHLLLGLLHDDDSRANTLFKLQELLPDRVAVHKESHSAYPFKNAPALADDGKRVLAYAAREARQLNDYWIDTEHLLLGILRDGSAAAVRLKGVGIDLMMARRVVGENKTSRPNYGPVPRFWKLKYILWSLA